jgi:hypothetical protein
MLAAYAQFLLRQAAIFLKTKNFDQPPLFAVSAR